MKKIYFALILFIASVAFGASYLTGDAIRSPDRTLSWPLPSESGTLVCTTCTQTLTNKTFSLADSAVDGLTAGSVLFHDGNNIVEDNTNFYWDNANNRLGIGVAASENTVTINGTVFGSTLSVHAEGATDLAETTIHRHSDTAGFGSHLIGVRSRGTEGAETVVQSGDYLMRIDGLGHDGTDYEVAAQIDMIVGGTPGNDDMPGSILFKVTPDGSVTPATAVTIGQDKSVTYTGIQSIPVGSSSAPSISFTGDTDTGFYSSAANKAEIVAGSYAGLQVSKSTGNFANVGMGGNASASDSYPLVISRSNTSTTTTVQVSNASTSANASAELKLAADNGTITGSVAAYTAASTIDAYDGAMVIKATDSSAKLSLAAPYTSMYAGGYTASDETLRINADQTIQFPQAASGVSAPSAGVKVYAKSDGKIYKYAAGGSEKEIGTGSGQSYQLLLNGDMEEPVVETSWTVDNGTPTEDASVFVDGAQGMSLSITTVNGDILTQTVTPTQTLTGVNLEHSMWVKTAVTDLQVCAMNATTEVQCIDVSSDDVWHQYVLNLAAPSSGAVGVRLQSTSSVSGTIKVDAAYTGLARGIGTIQQASIIGTAEQPGASNCSFGETTSTGESDYIDLGTAGSCASSWTTTGDVTATGATAHTISVSNMPPGKYEITLSGRFNNFGSAELCNWQFSDGTNTFGYQEGYGASSAISNGGTMTGYISYDTAATRTFKVQASDTGANGCSLENSASGRKLVWIVKRFPSAGEQVVRANQDSLSSFVSCSVTASMTTNTTTTAYCKRVGDELHVNGKLAFTGAPDNVSLVLTLPYTMDTSKIGAVKSPVGQAYFTDSGVNQYDGIVQYTSSTTVTVLAKNASATYLTGSTIDASTPFTYGSGDSIEFAFKVPISGWIGSQLAPALVGSVTSNSTGMERIERANVTMASGASCTVNSQSGSWISSTTPNAAGDCTLTIASGIFSSAPDCTYSVTDATNLNAVGYTTRTLSVSSTSLRVGSTYMDETVAWGAGQFLGNANPVSIICMGPR